METFRWRAFFFSFAAVLLFSSILSPQLFAGNKLKLANGEWEPYQSEKLPYGGPASRIVKEAFESQGYEVDFEYMPWPRGFNLAREARVDGTMLYSYNEERGRDFLYSDEIIVLETIIFHRKDKPILWEKNEDLKGITIGGVISYDYNFIKEEDGYILDRVHTDNLNYKKLAAGRIDALLEEKLVGIEGVKKENLQDSITYNPKPIKTSPFHLIISKKHPKAEEIIKSFNKGLKKLKEENKIDSILYSE